MTRITDSVEQFIGYFLSEIDRIESVENLMYKKILYATVLDPLARAAFGSSISHRRRITRLLEELTFWEARSLVSLPQLALKLSEEKRSRFRLYREVRLRLSRWPSGAVIRVAESPTLSELASFAAEEEQKYLTACCYAELFYTYRNNLVHEFREPGYGIEWQEDKEPHYLSMEDSPWQLVFPVGFFASLCRQAIERLRSYLLLHKIDPYTHFDFGSVWRAR
jgi:hypothetical protein